jgi:maltooligosyltrehalose trehalohydrolase
MPMPAYPSLGAIIIDGGVRFRVWAPEAARADVILDGDQAVPMQAEAGGYFQAVIPGATPGMLYRYRVNGAAVPDPASRCQPHGVHGPSSVVDPQAYPWRDRNWAGPDLERLVFYELHVGTFTPEGTFDGVRGRLPYLRDLGVTAIELMPVGDFPGRWNWGYDPAALFAPARAYGMPDDLRRLVDDAHSLGLAVVLDVVYNHFGPDGAYAVALAPAFLSSRHTTPWGPAINLDGEGAAGVRGFFIENALHWLHEYHVDGLRLDATHALVDDSSRHFLAELAAAVHACGGRPRILIAEDHRNLDRMVRPPVEGYGLDAVWSDDYHHQVRCVLTGQQDGYFVDFTRSTRDLAAIIRRGWLFTGQESRHFGGPRGTDPAGIRPFRFIHFIQNHDQVGNRPGGDRLSDAVSPAAYRAVSALLLCAPQTPLLFMGQEWAARSPFLYFTDHAGELGAQVSRGRQEEFKAFQGLGPAIPDPQDPRTFDRSRLRWEETAVEPHAGMLRLYHDLLAWRSRLAHETAGDEVEVTSPEEGGIALRRGRFLILAALRGGLTLSWPEDALALWHSEEPAYEELPHPPVRAGGAVTFPVPAVLIAQRPR